MAAKTPSGPPPRPLVGITTDFMAPKTGVPFAKLASGYVDSVLMRARLIGGLPSNFVGSLTGLTQGRFPVHARAKYAGQVTHKGKKAKAGQNAALVVESEQERNGIKIYARRGAPESQRRIPEFRPMGIYDAVPRHLQNDAPASLRINPLGPWPAPARSRDRGLAPRARAATAARATAADSICRAPRR